ncbi:MAG: SPOR domain-containing protein [Bacteroidales bacterium]|nr:SPOR domain-containing protein [Bacteroidales bacterium]
MKRSLFYGAMLILCLLTLGGCDFLRRLAGRPDSAAIEAKRAAIAEAEARHQARLDSLAVVEKQLADSLALVDSIRNSGSLLLGTGRLGGLTAAELPYRYYLIIGAFSNSANADRLVSRVEKAGIEPHRIPCRNGYVSVGILPANSLAGIYESLCTARTYDFCPKDAWVLVNE